MAINVKAIYDTCAQLVKAAESEVEKGNTVSDEILEGLKNSFEKIIEFEKIYLIQCQDKFYGSVLMDLDVGIDFSQRGPVDMKVDRSPFMISINPLFCADYKFSEFTGLIVEEIIRMVWLHPASFSQINSEKDAQKHELLEKASDAAASTIVMRDVRLNSDSRGANGCRLPSTAYTATQLSDDFNVKAMENMPIEYYYKILSKFNKKNPQDQLPPLEGPNQPQTSPGSGHGSVATKNNNEGEPTHNWEGSDKDEIKEQIKSIVSDAYNSLSETARGLMASSVESQIKALLAPPEINWKQVLRKMVGSVPVPYRKTRTRLNRRQPFRADLCGKLPKRTVNVVCCFDTSGSMSDDDLKYCMNEVFNIIKVYEGYKVTIIECDAEVQRVYQAKSIADIKTKMRGRGGTSFIPAIEFINGEKQFSDSKKYPLAGKFKDALMVYFTDGYGDYEIPKPKTYRNLWVVLHDTKCLSLKEPYGDVKSLSMDDDWKKSRGR